MSKNLIVGVDLVNYKNNDGVQVPALNIHTVKHTIRTSGVAVESIWIGSDRMPELYEAFMSLCKGTPSDLIGQLLDVSRGTKGYLEDMDFIKKIPEGAKFDF